MAERSNAAKQIVFAPREARARARVSWLPSRVLASDLPKPSARVDVAPPSTNDVPQASPKKDTVPPVPQSEVILSAPRESEADGSLLATVTKASDDARRDAESAMHAFVEAAVALTAIASSRDQRVERELVELARAIATRVITRELSEDPALLVALAREGIEALAEREAVVVKFSQDIPTDMRAKLAREIAERAPGTSVVFESDLAPGSCVVTSAQAYVDESVSARLDVVMEQLGFRHGDLR